MIAWLMAACIGDSPDASQPPPTSQVFRTPAGVAQKPLVARHTGLAIADELTVDLRAGVDALEAERIALDAGGELIWRGPSTGVYVVRFDDAAAAEAGYRSLAGDPRVAEVGFNRVMGGRSEGTGIGTSPGIRGLQWNIPALRLDAEVGWGDAEGVVVAVLDSGAAFEDYADDLGAYALAPDLSEVEFLGGYDFINDDAHPNDDHGHGTHVTGVIAASAGISALAPHADVLPVKVLDADNLGTELALAEGIRYATDHGADVINMSLSFPPTYFPSRYLQSSIDYAAQHGVVLVAAVGNHDEDVVTYPAAFRDVLAIGATSLRPQYRPEAGRDEDGALVEDADRWDDAFSYLLPAPYSNRGYLVDFAAPAGRIDQDLDGDGNPEAVLAQTFVGSDPTAFDYYFYAGTSQAAAEASGLAAVMLAANPDLTAHDVRQVIGDTAQPKGWKLLTDDYGRGRISADAALAAAGDDEATRSRNRYQATVLLTVHERGKDKRRARAAVEVLDEQGAPVPYVAVYGTFTGSAFEAQRRFTDETGVAVFKSDKYGTDGKVVAFQVDGIGYWDWDTWRPSLDRPRGFLRIDSVSLELLAAFATDLTLGDGLLGSLDDPEASSGAGGEVEGTGIGTSPGYTLPGSPEQIPITIRYDIDDSGPLHDMVPTLMLPNFSWGMATVPMAVVVEEEWFLEQFPDAITRRVVSFGSGIGTSPIHLSPTLSFFAPVELDYETDPQRVNLVLSTFAIGSGIGTSPGFRPIFVDFFFGSGIGTSPGIVDEALSLHWEYWWGELSGSGIGTSPGLIPGIPASVFDQLGNAVGLYAAFGLDELSAPVGAYGAVLEAAGLSLAPVDPMADGTGVGTSLWLP